MQTIAVAYSKPEVEMLLFVWMGNDPRRKLWSNVFWSYK